MAFPLWQDYEVTLETPAAGEGEPFIIRETTFGTVIYQGRAFVRPGEAAPRVRVNDICADWLASTLPVLTAGLTPLERESLILPVQFTIEDSSGEVDTPTFWNDWSYDPSFAWGVSSLCRPVNGHADAHQYLAYTVADKTSVDVVLTMKDGTTVTLVLGFGSVADYDGDFNNDFAIALSVAGSGSVLLDLRSFDDIARVDFDGGATVYDIVTGCHRYALHYLNAYGGWDSLLVEGNHLEADNYTRHTSGQAYDNATASARGERNYVNEVAKGWTLNTGLLDDEAAGRMHHLLGSPSVFLEDIVEDRIFPVVLTNSSCEYLQHSNGRRFPQYAITAQLAQQRVRR